jgi:hypothetical protein
MTIIGSLHDGQCKSASDCSCTPYLVRETPTEGEPKTYNGVRADNAGDSSAAANRIDSVIPPSDRLSPGPGGGLRTIEGIVR